MANPQPPLRPSLLLAPLLACAFGFAPASALGAEDAGEVSAGAGEALVVQVDFVVPEYKGGDKFRSPPTIDTALAEDLATRWQVSLRTVSSQTPADAAPGNDARSLRLATVRDVTAVPKDMAVVPIAYRAAPMAIMRSDTSIKRWEQLQGRKVCVAAGGNHVGTLAERYGALERLHPSPTDALVALREGACDAMVHDSTMLEELLRYPEWKKFSARLRGNQRSTLAFIVPAHDQVKVSTLRRVAFDWDAKGYPDQLVKKMVRDIAFEVYLEQDVPDCH